MIILSDDLLLWIDFQNHITLITVLYSFVPYNVFFPSKDLVINRFHILLQGLKLPTHPKPICPSPPSRKDRFSFVAHDSVPPHFTVMHTKTFQVCLPLFLTQISKPTYTVISLPLPGLVLFGTHHSFTVTVSSKDTYGVLDISDGGVRLVGRFNTQIGRKRN